MHYIFLAFYLFFFFIPLPTYAACINPTGIEGNQVYNTTYKVMQFCDGNNWISMKGGARHTLDALSCSDGEVAKWNNGGGVWECAADDTGGAETDPTVAASVKDGVDWSEITGIPSGFADGIDNTGGGGGSCRWVNHPSGCSTGNQTAFCASNEYVRGIRTDNACYISNNTWRTQVDLYCCKF